MCQIWYFLCLSSFMINYTVSSDDEFEEHLLCRTCGHEVAASTDFVRVSSPQALGQRNDTILGKENVLIQLLRNPHGRSFEVITTSKAHVTKQPQLYEQDTWFEGYSWKIISCPHCRAHLGWYYEPQVTSKHESSRDDVASQDGEEPEMEDDEKRPFFGLILNYLIHQQYADSLVIKPKFYGG
ncbi:uncharacterized protein [Diadema antillarum]|uniref:uncharacterized protein n=1 Tax=Diadema antillarum TaxID=105358 RepID=UPI003A849F08